jgi:hypothetical protein
MKCLYAVNCGLEGFFYAPHVVKVNFPHVYGNRDEVQCDVDVNLRGEFLKDRADKLEGFLRNRGWTVETVDVPTEEIKCFRNFANLTSDSGLHRPLIYLAGYIFPKLEELQAARVTIADQCDHGTEMDAILDYPLDDEWWQCERDN